jgi:hypothetical protein
MSTPLEEAEHEAEERGIDCCGHDVERIIGAFLFAASRNEAVCTAVGNAASQASDQWFGTPNPEDRGRAAIIALMEGI